jgi:hypothetical protein
MDEEDDPSDYRRQFCSRNVGKFVRNRYSTLDVKSL